MRFRRFGLLLGAGILVCVAVPRFATGVTPTQVVQPVGPVKQMATPGRGIPRSARAARPRAPLAGPTPAGCTVNTPPYFVGIGGGADNYAGGGSEGGYAGVVAGQGNEACDYNSGVLAGFGNVIGGNDTGFSALSIIGAGQGNTINDSSEGFIGAGLFNSISTATAGHYGFAYMSAVVAGYTNAMTGPRSFIGAGYKNSIAPSSLTPNMLHGQSAFVGAGYNNLVSGNYSAIVSGQSNTVAPDNSTVVGGQGNVIEVSSGGSNVSDNSAIVGGVSNTIVVPTTSAFNGQSAFIGAGAGNAVTANFANIVGGLGNSAVGLESAIGGGFSNYISAPASYATLGGGANNAISGSWATIAGGSANSAGGGTAAIGGGYENNAGGQYAAIPGGHNNTAPGFSAAIGGGATNTVSGEHATVPGGQSNIAAGDNSFAAGTSSDAANTGAFVWSDDASGATVLKSTASNQFLVRASGGFHFYSNPTLTSGVYLNAGSGTWSSLSDQNMKTNVVAIDPSAVLAKVAALPITEWSYRTEVPAVRHVGPMAQDFYAAFRVGEDSRHITAIDEEGVALVAIKALQREVAAKNRQITELQGQITEVAAKNRTITVLQGQVTELQDARHADEDRFVSLEKRLELLERNSQTANPQRSNDKPVGVQGAIGRTFVTQSPAVSSSEIEQQSRRDTPANSGSAQRAAYRICPWRDKCARQWR